MPFHQSGPVRYFTFDSFALPGLTHAVFTRQGGFSPRPWDSLNMGGFIGDDLQNVVENRVRAFRALDRDPVSVYDVWQVHSADVVCTDAPRPYQAPHLKADAILTDNPEVTLFMRFADCVPVLLYDPVQRVVGLVHAGWQGTVKKIVPAAVARMAQHYGTRPQDTYAGIGPSIGAHHYEVGEDVAREVAAAFGPAADRFLKSQNGAVQFDLWDANRHLLAEMGVQKIETAGICTACHPQDWFSHRGERGKTGRFGVLIALIDER